VAENQRAHGKITESRGQREEGRKLHKLWIRIFRNNITTSCKPTALLRRHSYLLQYSYLFRYSLPDISYRSLISNHPPTYLPFSYSSLLLRFWIHLSSRFFLGLSKATQDLV
jgi:hypothetical protein